MRYSGAKVDQGFEAAAGFVDLNTRARKAGHATLNHDIQASPRCRCRVPVGNLRPEILVVQSAQNWHRQHVTDGLDGTRKRRVLLQRQVRPSLVVIFW